VAASALLRAECNQLACDANGHVDLLAHDLAPRHGTLGVLDDLRTALDDLAPPGHRRSIPSTALVRNGRCRFSEEILRTSRAVSGGGSVPTFTARRRP
jgi:hypothetical protein